MTTSNLLLSGRSLVVCTCRRGASYSTTRHFVFAFQGPRIGLISP